MQSPEEARNEFYHDPTLANTNGHDMITDVLVSYLMSQICAGWSTLLGHSYLVKNYGGAEADTPNHGPSLLGGVGLRKGIPGQDPGDGDSVESSLSTRFYDIRVPLMRLADRPADVSNFREIDPYCVAASDLINPLPQSLFYGSGWLTYHPKKGSVYEERDYW